MHNKDAPEAKLPKIDVRVNWVEGLCLGGR